MPTMQLRRLAQAQPLHLAERGDQRAFRRAMQGIGSGADFRESNGKNPRPVGLLEAFLKASGRGGSTAQYQGHGILEFGRCAAFEKASRGFHQSLD